MPLDHLSSPGLIILIFASGSRGRSPSKFPNTSSKIKLKLMEPQPRKCGLFLDAMFHHANQSGSLFGEKNIKEREGNRGGGRPKACSQASKSVIRGSLLAVKNFDDNS